MQCKGRFMSQRDVEVFSHPSNDASGRATVTSTSALKDVCVESEESSSRSTGEQ